MLMICNIFGSNFRDFLSPKVKVQYPEIVVLGDSAVIKISATAFIYTNDKTRVFVVVQSDKYPENAYEAVEKNVTLIAEDNNFCYLKVSSLDESDKVIIYATDEIKDEDRIVIFTD